MLSVSLYRKYRPQDFNSVVGQKSALEVITNSITKNHVGHAYLFSGSRGCGKTSVARIFAKALNCLSPQGYEPCGKCRNCEAITAGESLDVIEIDGASNNGVENIRGLKENVTLAPFSSKYKVYIIDEVHMLSQGAFNALLKTLEEPPEYVVFILATTEPHKVPVTIRSRCQHIAFHSISPEDIFARLEQVCTLENVKAEPEALWEIARQADGALRDALSLLEQVIASGDVRVANVEAVVGAGSRPAFDRWVRSLRESPEEAYTALKSMFDGGASGVRVFEEMFSLVRDLWLVSKWQGITESLGLSGSEKTFVLEEVRNWKTDKLHSLLNIIMKMLTHARQGIRPDILLGMFLLYLEPASDNKVQPSIPTPRKPELPKNASVSATKTTSEENIDLKEELLRTAHENFIVYCALFDSRPYVHEGILMLDMEHRYCYEVLGHINNLTSMFGEFRGVILKHGSENKICSSSLTQQVQLKRMPDNTPAEPSPSQPKKHEPSAFDNLKRELAKNGAKPELLFVKQLESQEDNNDDTEGETES